MIWSASLLALAAGLDLGAVRVELISGRADLALPDGVVTLVGRAQAHTLEGPAYLETGAVSSVAVRWRSEASCELRGVNALEWRAPRDGRGVFVSAWRISELDFEVRRGPLRIDLGSGWRVELTVGAASVRTLADGRVELRHVAGSPLALHRVAGAGQVSPPWTLLPGAQVRLDPSSGAGIVDAPRARRALPPPPPGPESVLANEVWSGFAWPWTSSERPPPAANDAPSERASPARIESSRIAPAASERAGPSNPAPLDLPERRARAKGAIAPADDSNCGAPVIDRTLEQASAAGEALLESALERGLPAPSEPECAAPRSDAACSAPAGFDASLYPRMRRTGELVLTPFGPRWSDRP